jgi:hypothetical protein
LKQEMVNAAATSKLPPLRLESALSVATLDASSPLPPVGSPSVTVTINETTGFVAIP